jgi:intraflagellar transport protein 140
LLQVHDAINFYSRARCFNHGIRLAIEHELDADLLNLALQSTGKLMTDAARYFEERNIPDKAVLLYNKGGFVARAVELCFQNNLYESLSLICTSLPLFFFFFLSADKLCVPFFSSSSRRSASWNGQSSTVKMC